MTASTPAETHTGRKAPAGRTQLQVPADAEWTQSGRKVDAARTHPRAAVDAKRTQNARILDAVFDKLFLGSTVHLNENIYKSLIYFI